MSPNPLRKIPPLSELLDNPRLRGLVDRINRNVVVRTARKVLDEITSEVQTAAAEKTLPSVTDLAERIARRVVEDEVPRLRPVVNASGVLLCDELGAVPLAEEAVEEMAAVARDYAHVGFHLKQEQQSPRQPAVEGLLKELTGAEAALVVNNAAAATMLALSALAAGREVVISRGQMADHNGFRLPEITAAAGAVLREVGTTNRTGPDDYADAIGGQTAALMLIQPTNFAVAGSTVGVDLEELVALPQRNKTPVIHDLGFGGLIDPSEFGLGNQPTAGESIKKGADLVLLRGDKLLGGPPCGILLGRKTLIEKIEGHPVSAALGVDKLTLCALAVTLRLHRNREKVRHTIPLLQLLSTSAENLKNRAGRLAPQVAACDIVEKAEAVAETTFLGGVPMADCELSTWCVSVHPSGTTAEQLARDLRFEMPPILTRPCKECLLLDLRSVMPRQDSQLVGALESLTNRVE